MEKELNISRFIKAEALRLGFNTCGMAAVRPVEKQAEQKFTGWLAQGYAGEIKSLHRHTDKRMQPSLLMEGARSIISTALCYYPSCLLSEEQYQWAYYAYGKDYHIVVKQMLQELLQRIREIRPEIEGRAFCDTAPVLERYWAAQAGVGWIGKNRQLIIPGAGSYFVLGELFLNCELEEYDHPIKSRCGDCKRCLQACPTHALSEKTGLNAVRCLSYLTIEQRGPLPDFGVIGMGRCIYGCDRCQQCCPYNQEAESTRCTAFAPSEEFMAMQRDDWERLTPEKYARLFKESAVKRCRYEGVMRNIRAAISNLSPEEP